MQVPGNLRRPRNKAPGRRRAVNMRELFPRVKALWGFTSFELQPSKRSLLHPRELVRQRNGHGDTPGPLRILAVASPYTRRSYRCDAIGRNLLRGLN